MTYDKKYTLPSSLYGLIKAAHVCILGVPKECFNTFIDVARASDSLLNLYTATMRLNQKHFDCCVGNETASML